MGVAALGSPSVRQRHQLVEQGRGGPAIVGSGQTLAQAPTRRPQQLPPRRGVLIREDETQCASCNVCQQVNSNWTASHHHIDHARDYFV
jgi:hypothetical protein